MIDQEIIECLNTAIYSFENIKKIVRGNEWEVKENVSDLQNQAADAIGILSPILDKLAKRIIYWGSPSRRIDIFQESLTIYDSIGSGILDNSIAELKIVRAQIKQYGYIQNKKNIKSQKALKMNDIKVFIVHGHNDTIKLNVARTLEKLGLEPIILHEQANAGKTIIEKFETHSNVEFAIILLTADDEGKSKKETISKYRARQNVILEMGYFIGKLGRDRICVLYEDGVEYPSDLYGLVYTLIDGHNAWRYKLCDELKAAGYNVSKDKL